MKRHFHDELKLMKEKVFRMGLLVEEAIKKATDSLFERDSQKAHEVIKNDKDINLEEIEIDEMGHEFIALYQPAAVDVRLISMVLKITNDLERMGDQAVNIAEKALVLNQEPPIKPYQDLPKLTQAALKRMREAIDAFMEMDYAKARLVLESDDEIDQLNDQIYEDVQKIMEKSPQHIRAGVSIIMISHNLERIGDLATNIAEDVIYVERGIDVRHHIRERREENA